MPPAMGVSGESGGSYATCNGGEGCVDKLPKTPATSQSVSGGGTQGSWPAGGLACFVYEFRLNPEVNQKTLRTLT